MKNGKAEPKIKDLLWKMNHCRVRCGTYFTHIPGMEEKQYCECGQIETIDHILFQCENNATQNLWQRVKNLWNREHEEEMIEMSPGIVRGILSIKLKNGEAYNKGKTELFRELVTQTIWTVWKVRNHRIFEGEQLGTNTCAKMWNAAIRRRIEAEWAKISLLKFQLQEKARKDFIKKWCRKGNFASVSETNDLSITL